MPFGGSPKLVVAQTLTFWIVDVGPHQYTIVEDGLEERMMERKKRALVEEMEHSKRATLSRLWVVAREEKIG